MNVLLDEGVPHSFRHHLSGHDVRTVDYMGWKSTINGALLALATDEFDVIITLDQKIPFQQNLNALDVAVIILISGKGRIEDLMPLAPQVLEVIPIVNRGRMVRLRPDSEPEFL